MDLNVFAAAETAKKSKFSEQLKLLQQNQVNQEALEGGELGGNKDYLVIYLETLIYSRILEDLILKKIKDLMSS